MRRKSETVLMTWNLLEKDEIVWEWERDGSVVMTETIDQSSDHAPSSSGGSTL